MINKNTFHPKINPAQLTDGINLSKKEFASVAFRIDSVKLEKGEFFIKLALDNLSYEYAINKDIKNKIYKNLKLP